MGSLQRGSKRRQLHGNEEGPGGVSVAGGAFRGSVESLGELFEVLYDGIRDGILLGPLFFADFVDTNVAVPELNHLQTIQIGSKLYMMWSRRDHHIIDANENNPQYHIGDGRENLIF